MHARTLLAAAIVCSIAACSQSSAPPSADAATKPAAPTAAPAKPAAPAPAPALGIDLAGIDHSVKPGDDFFAYANGAWVKTAAIPPDRSNTGTFFEVFEKAEQQTSDLIKTAGASNPAAGSDARRIADYYAAFMDEAAIDKAGLDPLKPAFEAIAAIKTRGGPRARARQPPARRRGSDQRHQFPYRKPVRPVRDQGPGRRLHEHGLSAAGRPRHAQPRLLPFHRQGDGRASATSTRPMSSHC